MHALARPAQHRELQRGAHAPEDGGDGQRQPAIGIAPQPAVRAREVAQHRARVQRADVVAHAAVGHAEVERAGHQVHAQQDQQRRQHRVEGIEDDVAGVVQQPRAHEEAAQAGAQQHGAHRGGLDPGVGRHQLVGSHELGGQAVLGRRVGRGAQAHHQERGHRMDAGDQREHADDLDRVHPRHQARLAERVGQRPHERRQQHVRGDERHLEHGRQPGGHRALLQQVDGDDQQRVVRQGRHELGREQQQEGGRHQGVRTSDSGMTGSGWRQLASLGPAHEGVMTPR